jgi:hypothetical protein
MWFPTAPPRHQYQIEFSFDLQTLGQLPNAFGFVCTEGSFESEISLRLHDAFGKEISTFALFGIGDDVHVGDTDDHMFIGIISDVEIARVLITSRHIGDNPVPLQIDHVQYGRVSIPEPQGVNTLFLLTPFAVLLSHSVTARNPWHQRYSPDDHKEC